VDGSRREPKSLTSKACCRGLLPAILE